MSFLMALADLGFSLAGDLIEQDFPTFEPYKSPTSPTSTLPSITQEVETTVTVGAPTLTQAVSIGAGSTAPIPVVAPSTTALPSSSLQVAPALWDTEYGGPTRVQNIPVWLVVAVGVGAYAFAKMMD